MNDLKQKLFDAADKQFQTGFSLGVETAAEYVVSRIRQNFTPYLHGDPQKEAFERELTRWEQLKGWQVL